MTAESFKYIPASDIVSGKAGFEIDKTFSGCLAACFSGFFSEAEAKKTVQDFYNAREDWCEGFGGSQYALGEVWYHYAEEGIDFDEYGKKSVASRALVDRHVPGLEKRVLDFLSRITVPDLVGIRPGWAGPGIVVFPAGNPVACHGGVIHCDLDAFDEHELNDPGMRMFSFVCVLQKPEQGGGLQIWDKPYDTSLSREGNFEPDIRGCRSAMVEYRTGDLWMFNGLNAHQIQHFQGDLDRISLTFHMVETAEGWQVWF